MEPETRGSMQMHAIQNIIPIHDNQVVSLLVFTDKEDYDRHTTLEMNSYEL